MKYQIVIKRYHPCQVRYAIQRSRFGIFYVEPWYINGDKSNWFATIEDAIDEIDILTNVNIRSYWARKAIA